MKYSGQLFEGLDALVQQAEKNALAAELLPYHSESCSCRLCETDRWSRSEDAKEFIRRKS